MIKIPENLETCFNAFLDKRKVPLALHNDYRKWLRYYLDYCHKFRTPLLNSGSLPPFIKKLVENKQTSFQQAQAGKAIAYFYQCVEQHPDIQIALSPSPLKTPETGRGYDRVVLETGSISEETLLKPTCPGQDSWQRKEDMKNFDQSGNVKYSIEQEPAAVADTEKSSQLKTQRPISSGHDPRAQNAFGSANNRTKWKKILVELENEIKVRHYSPKTYKSYAMWVKKFQTFSKGNDPDSLSTSDVKEFLTFLAVQQRVSASSQNQAFNALLFFFRNILKKEFGKVDGVVRAKRRPYIPVVLSREEINRIIEKMAYPYDLVAKLLYGCGLRLSECLNLRINSLNLDAGILTVHDGKGQKDRTVPLPEAVMPQLTAHLTRVGNLHRKDLQNNYGGAFMMGQLEKKYKNAGKELIWQWLFPPIKLTYVPETKEYRRYHLHESHVQKEIQRAVAKAGILKRASAHTLRHSYASHLLQANYDIRTIQQLLGHRNIRTTMIYTHTVKSTTIKEPRSPLDL